jgi:hypothetical protein
LIDRLLLQRNVRRAILRPLANREYLRLAAQRVLAFIAMA